MIKRVLMTINLGYFQNACSIRDRPYKGNKRQNTRLSLCVMLISCVKHVIVKSYTDRHILCSYSESAERYNLISVVKMLRLFIN